MKEKTKKLVLCIFGGIVLLLVICTMILILRTGNPTANSHNVVILLNNDLQNSSTLRKYFYDKLAAGGFPGTFILMDYGTKNSETSSPNCIPQYAFRSQIMRSGYGFFEYLRDFGPKQKFNKTVTCDDKGHYAGSDYDRLKKALNRLLAMPDYQTLNAKTHSRDIFLFPEYYAVGQGSKAADYAILLKEKFGEATKGVFIGQLARSKVPDGVLETTYVGGMANSIDEQKNAIEACGVLQKKKTKPSGAECAVPVMTSRAVRRIFGVEKPQCSMNTPCVLNDFSTTKELSNIEKQLDKAVKGINKREIKYGASIKYFLIATALAFLVLIIGAFTWRLADSEDIPYE